MPERKVNKLTGIRGEFAKCDEPDNKMDISRKLLDK